MSSCWVSSFAWAKHKSHAACNNRELGKLRMPALPTESDPDSNSLSFRSKSVESVDNPAMKQSEDQSVKLQYITTVAYNMTEISIKATLAKLKLDLIST